MSSETVSRDDGIVIPTESGTVGATRYSPTETTGPLPVILMYIPYRKDDWIQFGYHHPVVEYFVRCGYEVVIADCLGTGNSTGFKPYPFSSEEGVVGKQIVEWLANQEWTTRRIGMYGKSYGGYLQLKTAAEQPDGLETIIPVMAPYQIYNHSRYPGGAMSLKHPAGWLPMMHGFASLPPSYRDDDGRWAEIWSQRLESIEESEPWLFQHIEHDTKDEYWREMDPDISAIDVPVFAVSGWRDYYPHAPLDHLSKTNVEKRILLGPWRHTNPERGRETAVDFRAQMVEWFDYFLKGEENGALDHPSIVYWTERDGGGKIEGGIWRGTNSWPRANNAPSELSFAFTPEGLTPSEGYELGEVAVEYEIDHTVGMSAIDYLDTPIDTNLDDIRALCFETPPMEQATEMTGTGSITIRFRPTTTDPLIVACIVDVRPDGSSALVTYGYLKPSRRNSHSNPEPLTPHEEYEITIPLQPVSHIFEQGHSIRVAVSGAWFPRVAPVEEHGHFTVLSTPAQPSELRFPGRRYDSQVRFDDTVSVNPPDDELVPLHSEYLEQSRSIEISREQLDDLGTMRITSEETIDLPHGPVMQKEEDMTWSVVAHDPATFKIESEVMVELRHTRETVQADLTTHITHDTAKLSERITIDGQTLFEKTWRK